MDKDLDSRLRFVAVAFLASSGDENDQAEAMRLGANAYLRKPSHLGAYAEIADRIREMLGATAPRVRGS